MTECKTCKYWNNDNGFCEVKMIPTLSNETCEHFEKELKNE